MVGPGDSLALAEIAAGLPLAASFAMASGLSAWREARRRTALNEAIHELRRPLQVLALSVPADAPASGPAESSLQMAAAAIDRLEREINGRAVAGHSTRARLRPLVEQAVDRWRRRAELDGKSVDLSWRASDLRWDGDAIELAQALDNMINNALEHGRTEIAVEAREEGGLLRIAVRDSGSEAAQARRTPAGWRARLGGRSRHGHGLRIVRRLAARHGGSFRLHRSAWGCEARLDLPLVEGGR